MSEEDIRTHVHKFLESTDWGEVLEDTYGAGLCYDVSEDFRKWLTTAKPETNAYLIYEQKVGAGRFKGMYPQTAGGHWILLLGGRWLVDLSAKQFSPHLPIPYIQDVAHLITKW